VVIDSADQLYAQLPIGAARLEARLARAGKLDVRIALVGMLEAPSERVERAALTGDCDGATHVIAGVQLGAFKFYAGGSGEIGAGLGIGQAGVGGSSTASQELLSADGDPSRCDAASTADARAPDGCGAVIRIELVRLGDPSCPAGARWDGQRCLVTAVHCPPGTDVVQGRCVARADASCPAGMSFQAGRGCVAQAAPPVGPGPSAPAADPDLTLCQEFCATALRCEAEARETPLPEGAALQRLQRSCQRMCQFGTNDHTRPRVRQCIAGGCATIDQCKAQDAAAG
jgi:hypothetical protein